MSDTSASAPIPPVQSPVAGKYELVQMIGRGGMGSVWEARHISLGSRFAIKFIEDDHAKDKEARTRFDNEARAAAKIQSKHAIQIFDHGLTEEGTPFIVMEMLSGEPLDKRLDRVGRMPLVEVAKILQQVSRGVARAHEHGVVHRDLKPENIFLTRSNDDDEEVPKVLDFGIAKMKDAQSLAASSGTKTGALLGTPYYMSPEQARGLRAVDHRTDIWSMGVIAFRCVTGNLPFDGESIGDLLVKICTAPVTPATSFVPGLPPEFDAWVARSLERDPNVRFSSVGEQAEALVAVANHAARGSLPSQGGPYSAVPATTPPQTHNPHFSSTPNPYAATANPGYYPPGNPGYAPPMAHANTQGGLSASYNAPPSGAPWVAIGVFTAVVALGGAGMAAYMLTKKAPIEPRAAMMPAATTTPAKIDEPIVVPPADDLPVSPPPSATSAAKVTPGKTPPVKTLPTKPTATATTTATAAPNNPKDVTSKTGY